MGSSKITGRRTRVLVIALALGGAMCLGALGGMIAYRIFRGHELTVMREPGAGKESSETEESASERNSNERFSKAEQKIELVTLSQGTPFETTAYVITSGRGSSGNTVLVLGGVHGDEEAGYVSPERLLKARVIAGTLIVIPRANQVSIRKGTREGTKDLNRCFPGSLQAANEERLAGEIFQLIQSRGVDLVLTCHASPGYHLQNRAYYGQTVIFDAPETRAIADKVVSEINSEISAHLEQYRVLIEPIPTSATYEIYHRLRVPAYGLEVAKPMGLEKGCRYHLRLIELFCLRVGLEVANWDEILQSTLSPQ